MLTITSLIAKHADKIGSRKINFDMSEVDIKQVDCPKENWAIREYIETQNHGLSSYEILSLTSELMINGYAEVAGSTFKLTEVMFENKNDLSDYIFVSVATDEKPEMQVKIENFVTFAETMCDADDEDHFAVIDLIKEIAA